MVKCDATLFFTLSLIPLYSSNHYHSQPLIFNDNSQYIFNTKTYKMKGIPKKHLVKDVSNHLISSILFLVSKFVYCIHKVNLHIS